MPPPRRRAGVPPTPSPRLRRASARAARAWPGREGNARAPGHYSTTPAMPLPRGPRAAREAAGAWSIPPTPCTRRTAPCVRGAGGSLQYALYLPDVARVRQEEIVFFLRQGAPSALPFPLGVPRQESLARQGVLVGRYPGGLRSAPADLRFCGAPLLRELVDLCLQPFELHHRRRLRGELSALGVGDRRILRRVEAEHLPVVCERFLEGGCVPLGLRVGHPFADGIQLCDDRGVVLTAVESHHLLRHFLLVYLSAFADRAARATLDIATRFMPLVGLVAGSPLGLIHFLRLRFDRGPELLRLVLRFY